MAKKLLLAPNRLHIMIRYTKTLWLFGIWVCPFLSDLKAQEEDKDPWADSARVYQEGLNETYKSKQDSPLKPKERKLFEGLDFFSVDITYRVEAQIVLTPEEEYFMMPTTSNDFLTYRKYGELHFELKGKAYQLNVYQNLIFARSKAFQNYLFLPFRDKTNGQDTYAGGRYLDLYHKPEEGDTIWLDFNRAYNPYCAYNEAYSCPIVPTVNSLETRIEAGVKKYKK